jgi:dynein heavy chain, axonemal
VPKYWKVHAYPSLKPLAGFITDLVRRLAYFKKWIETSPPRIHWISGFYFTHSFLTGIR